VGTLTIVAADRRQARTVMGYVRGLIHACPMLANLVVPETAGSEAKDQTPDAGAGTTLTEAVGPARSAVSRSAAGTMEQASSWSQGAAGII
jgi:hypothetical protein